MSRLLVATHNPGKLAEFQRLLSGLGAEVVSAADLGLDLDVPEPHDTYAENAADKAIAFCRASGEITLADDSGIEVAALDWGPGVRSARFAGPDRITGADLLLKRLAGVERPTGPDGLLACAGPAVRRAGRRTDGRALRRHGRGPLSRISGGGAAASATTRSSSSRTAGPPPSSTTTARIWSRTGDWRSRRPCHASESWSRATLECPP